MSTISFLFRIVIYALYIQIIKEQINLYLTCNSDIIINLYISKI
jgi:hypothetical protein